MNSENLSNLELDEPSDYFTGVGQTLTMPSPCNVLMFTRRSKEALQQEALQNRSHHRFVLIFNLQTRGHVNVDHLEHDLGEGQALLVFPFQFHHFTQLSGIDLMWLFCTFELDKFSDFMPLKDRVIQVTEETQNARDRLLKVWHQCTHGANTQVMRQQLQLSVTEVLLSLKYSLQTTAEDFPPEPDKNILRDIHLLMSEWRGRPVHVSDVAEALSFSESRLRVLFKEASGIPLGSYLLNYRINRAMSLLRTTRKPIAEICEDTGFASPQAFSRTFRNEVGQSPRQYRTS